MICLSILLFRLRLRLAHFREVRPWSITVADGSFWVSLFQNMAFARCEDSLWRISGFFRVRESWDIFGADDQAFLFASYPSFEFSSWSLSFFRFRYFGDILGSIQLVVFHQILPLKILWMLSLLLLPIALTETVISLLWYFRQLWRWTE